MQEEQHRYISYLLRMWQTESKGELVWRFSLEDPVTHKRQGFTSLEDLFDFLRSQVGMSSDGNGVENHVT